MARSKKNLQNQPSQKLAKQADDEQSLQLIQAATAVSGLSNENQLIDEMIASTFQSFTSSIRQSIPDSLKK